MTTDGSEVVPTEAGSARIEHSARTHVGNVRTVNEDSLLAQPPVYLVADGMGGHARGDAASRAVVETFRRHLDPDVPSTPERVLDAIHTSNDAVRGLSDEGDEGTAVAGTTIAGLALVDAGDGRGVHWMVFNVGDSRVYAWDGSRLHQVTTDHSAVQELVDAGVIGADEAERHPDRNVITRAMGADAHVEPDVWLIPASGRQVFLVCSDGLSKELDDAEIAGILAAHPAHDAGLAGDLVDAALAGEARDNVTAIVVESELPGADGDAGGSANGAAGSGGAGAVD
ncbi:PP2C family protein-serine/threonine phosphatase [Agromyces sp. SYSU T0242]|uniref:PP2C family protein-serine/threonine phosphatase n=1 Tax=Agromyces litoreus TaxID=3158561 RepID=UPI0033928122